MLKMHRWTIQQVIIHHHHLSDLPCSWAVPRCTFRCMNYLPAAFSVRWATKKQPLWHSIILIGLIWILILAYYESPYNWVVWSPISNNQPGFWTLLTVSQGLSWRLVNIPIPWVAAWVFGKACQEQGGLTLAVLPRQYPWWSLMTVKSCMKGDTWHTKPILPCFYSHRIHGTGIFTYLHVR